MGKNANFVSHKKSKQIVDGKPKLPLAADLVEGEIAINFGKDVETLSIKNESGDVVTFSSDNYYTEKKLGSGFTGENSANTVTSVIESNEKVTALALADLDERKLNKSAYKPTYTKAEIDARDLWVSGSGVNSAVLKGGYNEASGTSSVAEGNYTKANGNSSHAEGYRTTASGYYSHAEGNWTTASGNTSHAEGADTRANGSYSHAEGNYTIANNTSEHASGQYNVSSSASTAFGNSGNTLFSVGNGVWSSVRHNAFEIRQNGDIYITSGGTTESPAFKLQDYIGSGFSPSSITDVIIENEEIVSSALVDLDERKLDASAYTPSVELWVSGSGVNSAVLKGGSNTASGTSSVAEGSYTKANGSRSHAEGSYSTANGLISHAEGEWTKANGSDSHAEGYNTTASGDYGSHAEGSNTKASGNYGSHAEGYHSTASGQSSHAEGSNTKAYGDYSHAEGQGTIANGDSSHAEGVGTIANGNYSHVEGAGTQANNMFEHASGQFNISSSASTTFGDSGNTLFSVGNGTADNARHNAFEIRQNGDIYIVSGNSDIRLQDYIGGSSITVDQVIDSGTSASTDAVSTSAVYGFVTSYTPSITVDQVLDDTTSASTNPVSSKAVYDAVTDNELVWANAFVALSGTVSAHTANTEIHVTAADKARWDSSSDSLWASGSGVNSVVLKGSSGTASGDYSVAEGSSAQANGNYSHAEGGQFEQGETVIPAPIANGDYSHVEGIGTTTSASSMASHAEGVITQANGIGSHAEGGQAEASGQYSHAEGYSTMANGSTSHAEGFQTKANGNLGSHAEGRETQANGESSHAEGYGTVANNKSEHASGQYNVSSSASTTFGDSGNTLFSVGNGTWPSTRHNAFEIRQNGDIYITSGNSDIKLQDYIGGSVETVTAITPSNSGSTDPIATKVVAENELIVSTALNDLDERKLDASAYTPTDLSNYYTKSETSGATELQTALADKVDKTEYATFSAATNTSIEDLSGQSETVAAALNDLNAKKLDTTAYTPTDLSNYYTKSETSGATELSAAFSAKADTATTLAGYGITDAYTKSETSGATELSTAFEGKVNSATFTAHTADTTAHFTSGEKAAWNSFSAATNASIEDLSGQSETVAVALNELNDRKLDASAYTPTDLSNYYAKSETSGATELSTAFSAKADKTSIEDLSGQSETVAVALNELNDRISQLEEMLKNLNNN